MFYCYIMILAVKQKCSYLVNAYSYKLKHRIVKAISEST